MQVTSEHYDRLYLRGGFKYKYSAQRPYIKSVLIDKVGIRGKVLDAPCGDGFWTKALRRHECSVVGLDISAVGARKAQGIHWDINILNEELINNFDWVFCRGLSHFHRKDLSSVNLAITNLSRYAPNMLITYWTSQSRKDTGHHFMHTKKTLDNELSKISQPRSFMHKGMYHAILRREGCGSM